MSPTNDMKARLFVDMDGTLAVWKQAACFEDLLQPGYFRDLPPYQTVLDAVKILCNTKPELDVYALSAYMPENPYAVHEKNAWLDAYLPEIDSEHRIFVACGSSKARAAANRLKTPCIDNSFMLLDDYSVNLHEWKANRGSCIKLRNGINGNGGTWKGESVTRFDTAENYTAEEIRAKFDYEIEDENLEYYRRNTCYNDIFEALALESWLYNHCTNVPFVTFALQGIQNEAERYRYLQWLKAEIQ